MTRNLKILGLALVAVLAMSAMVASAASASNEATYRTAGAPANLHGTQVGTNIFHVPGAGTVECTSAVFTGEQATTGAHSVTVAPNYSSCKAFTFATAHVTENGCHYTFTTPTTTGSPTWPYHAEVHVVCPAGKVIEITPTVFGSSACTLTVSPQTPTNPTVDLRNAGTGVEVESTVSGISHSGGCGATAGAHDGSYTGIVKVTGSNGAVSIS